MRAWSRKRRESAHISRHVLILHNFLVKSKEVQGVLWLAGWFAWLRPEKAEQFPSYSEQIIIRNNYGIFLEYSRWRLSLRKLEGSCPSRERFGTHSTTGTSMPVATDNLVSFSVRGSIRFMQNLHIWSLFSGSKLVFFRSRFCNFSWHKCLDCNYIVIITSSRTY